MCNITRKKEITKYISSRIFENVTKTGPKLRYRNLAIAGFLARVAPDFAGGLASPLGLRSSQGTGLASGGVPMATPLISRREGGFKGSTAGQTGVSKFNGGAAVFFSLPRAELAFSVLTFFFT